MANPKTEKDYTIKELQELHKGTLTDEVISKLENGLQHDWTIDESSRQAGINPSSFYNYQKMSSEFREKMARAKDYVMLIAKDTVIKAFQDSGTPASEKAKIALDLLKRRQKKIYSERQELTGEDGKNLIEQIEVVIRESKDEVTNPSN